MPDINWLQVLAAFALGVLLSAMVKSAVARLKAQAT
jgi:hypothetical protein